MLKIAVIGTAGRNTDGDRLKNGDFKRMCLIVNDLIYKLTKEPYLISGGAAWADHIAVWLYIHKYVKYLTLYLPAAINLDNHAYNDTGKIQDAGRISNYYFRKFINIDNDASWLDLEEAIYKHNIPYAVGNGFHDRNNLVANVDAVIALTFGNGAKLKDGGTANTFKKYLKSTTENISYHVDLNDWKIYTPAIL